MSPPAEDTFAITKKLVSCLQLTPHHNNTIIACDNNARLAKPDDPRSRALRGTLHDSGFYITTPPDFPTFVGLMGQSTIDVFASNVELEKCHYMRPYHPIGEGGRLTAHLPVGLELVLPTSPRILKAPEPISGKLAASSMDRSRRFMKQGVSA